MSDNRLIGDKPYPQAGLDIGVSHLHSKVDDYPQKSKLVRFDETQTRLSDGTYLKGDSIAPQQNQKPSTNQRASSASQWKEKDLAFSSRYKFQVALEEDPYFTEKDYLNEKKRLLEKINQHKITVTTQLILRFPKALSAQIPQRRKIAKPSETRRTKPTSKKRRSRKISN